MKKTFVGITVFLVANFLLGCASAPRYTKKGATEEQFLKDRYACLQENQQRIETANVDSFNGNYSSKVMPSCSALASCLAARGYYQAEQGELVIPSGAVIRCSK